MYRDRMLVSEAEQFRNGANTHWLNSTLHIYYNCGSEKYKHLYPPARIELLEQALRTFVASKGVPREPTPEEVTKIHAYLKKLKEGQ